MVIFWSNSDGSNTVSQRQAVDYSMPLGMTTVTLTPWRLIV